MWGVAACFAVIANWVATLVTGRSPSGLHAFLRDFLRYATHVWAYVSLAADPYPSFEGDRPYPVDLVVGDSEPQNRWTVLFRIVLAVPAMLVVSAYSSVGMLATVLGWFASLARAEMPRGLRNAIALSLRVNQQLLGYLFVLTDRYPYSGPTTAAAPAEPEPPQFLPPDAYATVA